MLFLIHKFETKKMASTHDIIKQLEHEIALRKSEIATFESIVVQLSGGPSKAPAAVVESAPKTTQKKAGRGRPRKNVELVSLDEDISTSVSVSKPVRIAKGISKAGRPKARKRAKGTVVDSVISLMKRRKMFAESESIFRGIKSKHKEKTAEDLYRYLTVTLSNLKRRGELVAVKEDENGIKLNRNYWGLKRWLAKDGSIKSAFYFNQPAIEETGIAD